MDLDSTNPHFQKLFDGMSESQAMTEEHATFDWMAHGFENRMTFAETIENAIEDSSHWAISTNSPSSPNKLSSDPTMGTMQQAVGSSPPVWPGRFASQVAMVNSPMSTELMVDFNEVIQPSLDTSSPNSLFALEGSMDTSLSTPFDIASIEALGMQTNTNIDGLHLPFSKDGQERPTSTASMGSSIPQRSVPTVSCDLVTEHATNMLAAGLSRTAELSPGAFSRPKTFNTNFSPTTSELQRYVASYIRFFHPHLPFLHIPTLSFESADYTTPIRLSSAHSPDGQQTVTGGGSCLILSIAAFGALYERKASRSNDLFECAKRLISRYLEERRRANMTKTQFTTKPVIEREDTPLWLVQAMLLNVIYGHNCGDKVAAEVASNHCAALVSLARGAELIRPASGKRYQASMPPPPGVQFHGISNNTSRQIPHELPDHDWIEWKVGEERKRTLYAVFIISSMLATTDNHPPALTSSEICLDLPCDEHLWAAESAQHWREYGEAIGPEATATTFADSLTYLLMAAQRERSQNSALAAFGAENESELRPSTFGCLILVNALHNYIGETRQRHLCRQWTTSETEQIHAHIEPALRAWQAAWASGPTHSLERPNPFGAGPLSADCIPLLDLAYVRLFINLGTSTETFWHLNYDAMEAELSRGLDSVQNRDGANGARENSFPTDRTVSKIQTRTPMTTSPQGNKGHEGERNQDQEFHQALSSRRERFLRKAAFYAADSLFMSDKLGPSFAEYTSRELPVQSAMCTFDCAQVLAEWITNVQERIGKYVGIIGRDEMNLMAFPGILLLEDEDRKLIQKIDEVLSSAEHKIEARGSLDFRMAREGGHGSRILVLTAYLLEKDTV